MAINYQKSQKRAVKLIAKNGKNSHFCAAAGPKVWVVSRLKLPN